MPYVYILKSKKDGNHYIGSTVDLEQRLKDHNNGRVKSTYCRRPLMLYGIRKFTSINEAALWEKKYKRSHGQLNRDIKNGKIILIKRD